MAKLRTTSYLQSAVLVIFLSVSARSLQSPDTFRSIIQSSELNGLQQNHQTFDFGREFFVDDILAELQHLGLRPKIGEKKKEEPEIEVNQTVSKSSDDDFAIVHFNLDYSDNSDAESHRIHTRSSDVSDILEGPEPVKGERQARLFYNFDRGSAFNTSVAFTIPLFSFTLPGAGDVTDGVDGNVFGTMAFVSLFLLGGLGVAIYTTTQGAIGDGGDSRMLKPLFPGSQFLDPQSSTTILSALHEGVTGLSEALEVKSCFNLAVCEAYQQPHLYGFAAIPLKIWAPLRPELPDSQLTEGEKAARLGSNGVVVDGEQQEVDCQERFRCIVDPVDTLDFAYRNTLDNFL